MALLKISLLALAITTLTSCHFSYYVKGGYYQAKILARRESIDKVMQNPNTKADVKRKLGLAKEVLTFIESDLGLETKGNYDTFVQLDDRYVSWAVTAAEKYKLKAYLWSFPLVGKVPYKGFFVKQDAELEAAELRGEGLDTLVRGVSAFSTLGWLDDPILSSMLNYRDEDFVNTLIHETVHANLYIKSAADFNEQLATFIGNKGAEAFFKSKPDMEKAALKYVQDSDQDEKLFSEFLSAELKGLEEFYAGLTAPNEDFKAKRLSLIKDNFKKNVLPRLKSGSYTRFAEEELNNAILISYKTYLNDLSDFEKVFKKHNDNFKEFFNFCKSLEKSDNPKEQFMK